MIMRIKELRQKCGLDQAELAAQVGVAQPTVSGWEQEVYLPPTRKLPYLARVLGCTIDELFVEFTALPCERKKLHI